ncbi:hypothetical protein [Deinococcus apachensis]|uniref:hypothetical protein n=1 Tax=Deinococcus apachensis TaxID=309886 RepID=UPI0003807A7C|nr:hypothetical protein [Deinococcus apachensis]
MGFILNGLGFGVNTIAQPLSDVFSLGADALGSILKALRFDASAITGALKAVFDQAALAWRRSPGSNASSQP